MNYLLQIFYKERQKDPSSTYLVNVYATLPLMGK